MLVPESAGSDGIERHADKLTSPEHAFAVSDKNDSNVEVFEVD